MHAQNLEISNTRGDMNHVICHFELGSLGPFFVTALVVCLEAFFAIGSGCKSTTIDVTSRRHTWGQLHCRHLWILVVVYSSDIHLSNVDLELMEGLDNRGQTWC